MVGGYGAFGSRVCERLAASPGLEIVVCGRNRDCACAAASGLAARFPAAVTGMALDAATATPAEIAASGARVVINASGPFQSQDYTLARACIAAGCHYVDLADARAFVTGIGALDAAAKAAGVRVISGASTVPGLSSAVVAANRSAFARLETIDIGVSPGNSFDPGGATTASILGYVGRPIAMRIGGRRVMVHGWQGLSRHRFPALGARLMAYADVPDLDLFAAADPGLRTVRMYAGVEVAPFHLGLWGASWLVRAGLVRDLPAWTPALLAMKRRFGFLGSDRGGMFVTMTGRTDDGAACRLDWHLEAGSGHGPYVPALPCVILARRLAGEGDSGLPPGATACVGLFTLADFADAAAGLDIRMTVDSASN